MSLLTRLRKLETSISSAECRECRNRHRSIVLRGDEPEPAAEPCARCGRPMPLFVIRLVCTERDGQET